MFTDTPMTRFESEARRFWKFVAGCTLLAASLLCISTYNANGRRRLPPAVTSLKQLHAKAHFGGGRVKSPRDFLRSIPVDSKGRIQHNIDAYEHHCNTAGGTDVDDGPWKDGPTKKEAPPKNLMGRFGSRVLIQGLTSDKGRQLNEKMGTLEYYHKTGPAAGRYQVILDTPLPCLPNPKVADIKPENLVSMSSLSNAGGHVGKCRIHDYIFQGQTTKRPAGQRTKPKPKLVREEEPQVQTRSDEKNSASVPAPPPDSLRPGTRVVIQGFNQPIKTSDGFLTDGSSLNGKKAKIECFYNDPRPEKCHYRVMLDNLEVISVNPENVVPVEQPIGPLKLLHGARVLMQGFTSAKAAPLNGMQGTIKFYNKTGPAAERYRVQVDNGCDVQQVDVYPENIVPMK